MDLEDIPRRAGSCDLIVCCHVIEHVPDHRKAIRSLVRILSDEGLLFLAYPDPIRINRSRDWGYPNWTQHGHFRMFGRDSESEYRTLVPRVTVIAVTERDAVTGVTDLHYLITRNPFWKMRILAMMSGARVV